MATVDSVAFAEESLFRFDQLMAEHRMAMACRDCEELLDGAITSLRWLERAEETIIEAENDCLIAYSQEAHEAIKVMYRRWLDQATGVRELIVRVTGNGFVPEFLAEFDACWFRANQWLQLQQETQAATLSHEQLSAYARQSRK